VSVFARTIKYTLNVTVQRPHDADARKHRWPVKLCDHQYTPKDKAKITAGAVAALVITGRLAVLALAFLSAR
jgi:hypothetical protein